MIGAGVAPILRSTLPNPPDRIDPSTAMPTPPALRPLRSPGLALFLVGLLPGCLRPEPDPQVLRIGHFPHLTHAPALVARARERTGTPYLPPALGVRARWIAFQAGPTAMEALLAGSVDASFVGVSPALNAHLRSRGKEVYVVAGAVTGGAGLVVRKGTGIASLADLRGRRIATPQLGNSQDVACRAWLSEAGLSVRVDGGDARLLPMSGADALARFSTGDLDAAFTVEPWITRLERETGATLLRLDEAGPTTVLVASRALLDRRPEVARALVRAHADTVAWMEAHPEEAQRLARAAVKEVTHRDLSEAVVAAAWPRLRCSADVPRASVAGFVEAARRAGFLEGAADVRRFVEVP